MLGLGSDEDMVRTDADVSSYGYLRLGVILKKNIKIVFSIIQ